MGKPTPGLDASEEALEKLLRNPKYALVLAPDSNSNAKETFHGTCGDCNVKITSLHPGWFTVDVAFGEVRNVWQNHTPLGEFGLAHASSNFNGPNARKDGPQGVPGHNIAGMSYRIGVTGPKGRTSSGLDLYIESSDIVAFLLSFRHSRLPATNPEGLTSGLWDEANQGW